MGTTRTRLILAVCLAAGGAVVFAFFGSIGRGGFTLSNVGLFGGIGAVFGAMAAPEVEPKWFPRPVLWQVAFCVLGFVLLAFSLDAPFEGYALAVVTGLILGYLAPYWLKHLQAP